MARKKKARDGGPRNDKNYYSLTFLTFYRLHSLTQNELIKDDLPRHDPGPCAHQPGVQPLVPSVEEGAIDEGAKNGVPKE